MAFAPARVTPFVVQRLQVPVQVLVYAGLFVCAQYLVNWLHLPLPANLVGMLMLLALIVCRIIPLKWVRAGARWLLAEMLLFFVPAVGGGGQLHPAADGGRLAYSAGDRAEHDAGAGRHGVGGG
ncbi:Holin-like protein CidA [Raoultella terrigena]|uniref:Holin-like protein CidA n=1 Tax=Raoultella terrigena TaxID=577 RepID=A0A3P8L345_RAOTE|nr:Holin-like protein CidA [Raoultella terrigena]